MDRRLHILDVELVFGRALHDLVLSFLLELASLDDEFEGFCALFVELLHLSGRPLRGLVNPF